MRTSNRITLFIAVILAAVFILGVAQLFILRFDEGNVYAWYSSFRSDPIGVRALYEALSQLGDISVQRNIEPISQLPDGRETTLFLFGTSTAYPFDIFTRENPTEAFEKLETFAAQGGRIVIAFYPRAGTRHDFEEKSKDTKEEKDVSEDGEDSEKEDEREEPPWALKLVSIADRWGFTFERSPAPDPDKRFLKSRAVRLAGPASLPVTMSWHSALYFDTPDEAWNTVYARDKHAVVMERRWVKGSIVLCSDSYFLSNEAMRDERYPELIAWLVGPSSAVIFDEVHLGTTEQLGVMSLVRRYRLEGVLVAIVVVGILFAWKNASSLTPKRDMTSVEYAHSVGGKASAAALVNLLRRSIPPSSLLSVCAREWERSAKVKSGRRERIKAIVEREQSLPARERNPVAAYRTICGILKERD